VASLVDLAGMKMRVIQVRGIWKDYVDIHALVSHGMLFLALLGGLAARAGGASVTLGAVRVTFWSALAMAATASVGALFGT
jgi:VIT1/CCC1 family predicted Fe2+/Mn2+ transporter